MAKTVDFNVYEMEFRAGEIACVAIEGDGSTNLDLVVLDENLKVVADDNGRADHVVIMFIPSRTGVLRVGVLNHGNAANDYRICVW